MYEVQPQPRGQAYLQDLDYDYQTVRRNPIQEYAEDTDYNYRADCGNFEHDYVEESNYNYQAVRRNATQEYPDDSVYDYRSASEKNRQAYAQNTENDFRTARGNLCEVQSQQQLQHFTQFDGSQSCQLPGGRSNRRDEVDDATLFSDNSVLPTVPVRNLPHVVPIHSGLSPHDFRQHISQVATVKTSNCTTSSPLEDGNRKVKTKKQATAVVSSTIRDELPPQKISNKKLLAIPEEGKRLKPKSRAGMTSLEEGTLFQVREPSQLISSATNATGISSKPCIISSDGDVNFARRDRSPFRDSTSQHNPAASLGVLGKSNHVPTEMREAMASTQSKYANHQLPQKNIHNNNKNPQQFPKLRVSDSASAVLRDI